MHDSPLMTAFQLMYSFTISYLKYYFFSASVLFSVAVMFFIVISTGLETFTYIPFFSGEKHADEENIVTFFSLAVLALCAIGNLIKWLIRIKWNFSIQHQAKFFFTAVTLSYLIAFSIIFVRNMEPGLIFIFGFFYLLNLIFLGLFFAVHAVDMKVQRTLRNFEA